MFVGVCGYGATGSSAVVGLLKEYPELMVCDKAEIQEAFKVDGLQDLEYHLVKQYSRHISGDAAIVRFKKSITYYKTPVVKKTIPPQMYIKAANKFVDSLIQGSWYGIDNIDYNTGHPLLNFIILLYKKLVFPNYEKLIGHPFDHWPARKMYLSINPEGFYEKAKCYTDELIRASGADPEQTVVFDQVFEGNAPQNCFSFFRDPKAIVVDRDPRDLWLVSKYARDAKGEARFMPRQDVKVFVEYYKRIRENQERKDTDRILFIRFEDAIYNYDETVKRIEAFLGCENHAEPKKYFKPEISINNTRLMDRYPQCKKEIEYIEKMLPEYLFDFSKYPKVDYSGVMF